MFIVSIFGGLGSQMEQYAFLLALRKAYPDTIIKVDINNVVKPDHNGYELEKVFDIHEEKASINEVSLLSDVTPINKKYRVIYRILNLIRKQILGSKSSWITPDDPSAYYEHVFKLNPLKSYMFFGNWGNEKYRLDVKNEIIKAFRFPELITKQNKEIAKIIEETESVSLHVRHGDYNTFGFPILSLSYYKKAIDIICNKVKEPVFFLFSDDIDYVKENFSFLPRYYIVDWNKGKESFRDMQLMSRCKHNIIANSTFSFWGARLNTNMNAIKIAPKYHVEICKHSFGEGVDNFIVIDNNSLEN